MSAYGWHKSSYSGGQGNCVEVGQLDGDGPQVAVRDTKQGTTGPVLAFTAADWSAFIASMKTPQV